MKKIQIEYPDNTVHYAECYRLAMAKLPSGEMVHFIEYYDLTDTNNRIDSYAIVDNKDGKWYKKTDRIGYGVLSNNIVQELDVEQIDDYLVGENSKELQTQTKKEKKENPPHTRSDTNQKVIFVPVIVDTKKQQYIYPVLPGVGFESSQKKEDKLNDEEVNSVSMLYRFNNVIGPHIEQGTFKYEFYEYIKTEIPNEVENYFLNLTYNAAKNGEYKDFSDLKDVVIDDTVYRFIKKLDFVAYDYDTIRVMCEKNNQNKNDEQVFQDYMIFNAEIARGYTKSGEFIMDFWLGKTFENQLNYAEYKIMMMNAKNNHPQIIPNMSAQYHKGR